MSKLKIYRKSGNIVDSAAALAFRAEWGPLFDKIQARIEMIHADRTNRLWKLPSHVLSYRFCSFIERQLYKKHSTVVEVSLPKSARAWNDLITSYDNNPVMLAQRADGKGLVMVIIDTAMQD